jgi:hypothetical protein
VFCLFPSQAFAKRRGWNPIKAGAHVVSSGAKASVAMATVPVKAAVATVTPIKETGEVIIGKESIGKAAGNSGKALLAVPVSAGAALNATTDVAARIDNIPIDATKTVLGLGGKPGNILGDGLTIGQQLSIDFTSAGLLATGNILQGKNPLEAKSCDPSVCYGN